MLVQSQTRWSVRLKTRSRNRLPLLRLARELLHADVGGARHFEILSAAFETGPPVGRGSRLAARTTEWMSVCPVPRLEVLSARLAADKDLLAIVQRHALRQISPLQPARMRTLPGVEGLPDLATVRALGDWLRLDPEHLVWFADLKDWNGRGEQARLGHYVVQLRAKADGSVRLVEAPKQRMKAVQRQVYEGILARVALHPAVHGFRPGRSIVSFAAPHAGTEAVLRMDLREFFPSISGPRVQTLFRTLGYPEAVADLLGGLCTTTTPAAVWAKAQGDREEIARLRGLYRRSHLPQGAPTSPAVANLCAFRLDRRLAGLAASAGAAYTRYADDLAFSGGRRFARCAELFAVWVAAIATEEGFGVYHRKTRLMRASVRQRLAGLTVNVAPNVGRREVELLEATLFNCVRRSPEGENRDGHPEFRRHLEGRVAFHAMVNPRRAERLRSLLERIVW